MSLLDTTTGFTTPWHCSVALLPNGEWVSAPMGEFQKNPRMKLICENGRPSYFQKLSEDPEELRSPAAPATDSGEHVDDYQPPQPNDGIVRRPIKALVELQNIQIISDGSFMRCGCANWGRDLHHR